MGIIMNSGDIIEKLESLSPVSFAEEWDNTGLIAGRRDKEVMSVYVALDATDEVIDDALMHGADMLITHHPLIFKKISRVNTDDFIGRRLYKLIRGDICCYAMHTNFDVMGMADAAADEIELKNRRVLDVTYEDSLSKEGCGRVGELPKLMSVEECAELVKQRFHVPNVRVFGEPGDIVGTVALMPGSGGGFIEKAIDAGAELIITGDIDHHEGIDAVAQGISVIDAGHYGIEKLFIPYIKEYLTRELPELEVITAQIKEPFTVL